VISVQDTTDADDNELRIENTEVDSAEFKYGNELYIRNEVDCAETEEYVLNI